MLNPPKLGQTPKVGSRREIFLHFETKAMRPLSTVHRQAVRVLNPPELGQTPKVGSRGRTALDPRPNWFHPAPHSFHSHSSAQFTGRTE